MAQFPTQSSARHSSPILGANGGGIPQDQVQGNRSSTPSGSDDSSQTLMDYTPATTQSEAATAAEQPLTGVKRAAAAEELSGASEASSATGDTSEPQA